MAIIAGVILTALVGLLFVAFIRRPDKDEVAVGMASASVIVFVFALWLGILMGRFL